jgi:hypothetical protein
MECPNCKSNTRSIGMEGGDEKRCSHCGVPLILVEIPKRHWEVIKDFLGE